MIVGSSFPLCCRGQQGENCQHKKMKNRLYGVSNSNREARARKQNPSPRRVGFKLSCLAGEEPSQKGHLALELSGIWEIH
jgi:hypothetical protein